MDDSYDWDSMFGNIYKEHDSYVLLSQQQLENVHPIGENQLCRLVLSTNMSLICQVNCEVAFHGICQNDQW